MLSKGLKRILGPVFLLTFTLSILGSGMVEASRRIIDLYDAMETRMVTTRKLEISGKLIDVCIKQAEKTITVRDFVEGWDELERVEDYFKKRGPYDYQVTCDLDFGY